MGDCLEVSWILKSAVRTSLGSHALSFDRFEIDVGAQELRVGGTVLAVEPQVLALLVYLVENRDRVVTRDDILEAVWHGRIVSESVLSSRVKAARQAIGDDGTTQRLIRTSHKRGFRFVGSVEAIIPESPASADAIAGAVEAQIEFRERGRSLLKPSEDLDAWEAYHRGCWHMYKFQPEHYEEAERFFLRSLELDASSPRPSSGLSFVHWQRAFLEISKDRRGEIARATELAEAAIALDPRDPQGHHVLGRAHLLAGDLEASERELQKSVDLNPSFAMGHYSLAYALYFAGLNNESQQAVSRAQSLSPYDPMRFAMLSLKALSMMSAGAVGEAAILMEQAVEEANAHYHIVAIAVIAFAAAQKREQSTHYLQRLRTLRLDYNSETYLRAFPLFRDQDIRLAKRVFG